MSTVLVGSRTPCLKPHNIYSRLVDDIRNAPDVSSNALLSKIWDRPANYDPDEQFKADLRAASGIGRRGKGKVEATFSQLVICV